MWMRPRAAAGEGGTMGLNLATILRESARSRPDKAALISGAARVTYAELDAASDRFAAGLARRGLVAGDAVALQLPNLPQFVVAYFGILKAGCVAVPVNPLYKAGEVGYVLRDSGARLMVTWAGSLEEAAKGAADAGVERAVRRGSAGIPGCRRRTVRTSSCWRPLRPCRRCTRPIPATSRWSSTPRGRPAGRRVPNSRTSSCS